MIIRYKLTSLKLHRNTCEDQIFPISSDVSWRSTFTIFCVIAFSSTSRKIIIRIIYNDRMRIDHFKDFVLELIDNRIEKFQDEQM